MTKVYSVDGEHFVEGYPDDITSYEGIWIGDKVEVFWEVPVNCLIEQIGYCLDDQVGEGCDIDTSRLHDLGKDDLKELESLIVEFLNNKVGKPTCFRVDNIEYELVSDIEG